MSNKVKRVPGKQFFRIKTEFGDGIKVQLREFHRRRGSKLLAQVTVFPKNYESGEYAVAVAKVRALKEYTEGDGDRAKIRAAWAFLGEVEV